MERSGWKGVVAGELAAVGNRMKGLRSHVKQFGVQSVGRGRGGGGCYVRALKQGMAWVVRMRRLGFARSSERAGWATLRTDHDARR